MTPGIFQPVSQSLFSDATSCVEAQGGHYEDFLQHLGDHNYENMLHKAYFH
jgi:hypothetical protein